MTINERILHTTIKALKKEFAEKGWIEILTIHFDNLEFPGELGISADCSFVCTEWDEGIYYDGERRRYFFYGEAREFSYGGDKTIFKVYGKLMSIIPIGLVDILQKVATSGRAEVVNFSESRALE